MLFIRSSSFVYTTNAQVQLERQGSKSVSHAYNMDGSKRFIGYEGMHYNLMRDSSGNITAIRRGVESYTLTYDQASRQTSLTYPNRIESKSAFDPLGRLTNRSLGEQPFLSYQYDKTSRIVQKNNLPITYDSAYRILQVGSENYTYDDAGNLLGENTHIDPITQRLMRQGDTAFTYDSLGRLSEKRSPVSRTTYRYDSQSYLIEYLKTEADYEIRFYFTYDPLGRRLTKHYIGKNGEYHHRYLYAGDNIVAIYDHDTEELLATLLHDETIDTPLSISVHPKSPLNPEELERYESLDETEQYLFNQSRIQTYYYHRDYQNSIMMLSDKSGEIIESYEYDVYGNITHHSKILETYNPYGYTGRETDTDDLYYYRARYYDPTIGRFITPDPIGFLGGDTNFYWYVGNDPINYTDPSGLSGLTALLDQHNPLKDLVEWWSSTPDTSVPKAVIPNSIIPQGKTASQTNKSKAAQTTAKTAQTNKGDGVKIKGNVKPIVDEKCKDQKWHDPIDNPQLAKYNINGANRPWSNTFGMVRIYPNSGLPKKHQGVDLFALTGTPVYACVDGIIVRAIYVAEYGNIITIKAKCPDFVRSQKRAYTLQYAEQGEKAQGPGFNENGDFYFMYAHLSETDAHILQAFTNGERVEVKAGQIIGKTGTSGYPTSRDPHLHFEILNIKQIAGLSNRVNPAFYVDFKFPESLSSSEHQTQTKTKDGLPNHSVWGDPSLNR